MSFMQNMEGAKRFEKIISTLIKHESSYFVEKELSIWKKNKRTKPETIRLILEELGGAFVKLGQLLSLRPDLIPLEYCAELSKLQDSVKPFPFKEAKKIIETSTGKKINELFQKISLTPVASASVGQVYKAKLKTGETVAVKVKRPGIEKTFEQDIVLMGTLANMIKKIHGTDIVDPEEIVSAFKEYTKTELDYEQEARTIEIFYENLKNTGIKVPKPYTSLTTKNVLIMEFLEGHELKILLEKKGFPEYKKTLSKELFNSFLKQIMIDGAFHADPHPSNIIIRPGKQQKLALLDFGITGTLTPLMRAEIAKLFISLNSRDIEGVVTAMMHMNMLSADNQEIRRDFREMLSPYYGAGLNKVDFPKLFIQSIKVARRHKVKIPRDYVLLGKTVLTLESVCVELYPEFNFVEESKPFITRLMIHEYAPSQFIARNVLRMENAKKIAYEIPSLISRIFSKDDARDKRVEELSQHILKSEHRLDVLIEKLILMFATLILLVAGLALLKTEQGMNGIPIFSIISFCLAAATFLLALTMRSKN